MSLVNPYFITDWSDCLIINKKVYCDHCEKEIPTGNYLFLRTSLSLSGLRVDNRKEIERGEHCYCVDCISFKELDN